MLKLEKKKPRTETHDPELTVTSKVYLFFGFCRAHCHCNNPLFLAWLEEVCKKYCARCFRNTVLVYSMVFHKRFNLCCGIIGSHIDIKSTESENKEDALD
jgi:hypothetical protein